MTLTTPAPGSSGRRAGWALGTAATAALLASSCCLLPLTLVSVGFSGAWLGTLRVMRPYSPWLIGIAIAALGFAGRSLFRNTACAPAASRAMPRSVPRAIFWVITSLTVLLLVTPVVAPWLY